MSTALSPDEPDLDKVVKWLEHHLGVHLLGWQVAAMQRYRAEWVPIPDEQILSRYPSEPPVDRAKWAAADCSLNACPETRPHFHVGDELVLHGITIEQVFD